MTLGSLAVACGIYFPNPNPNWECDILAPEP